MNIETKQRKLDFLEGVFSSHGDCGWNIVLQQGICLPSGLDVCVGRLGSVLVSAGKTPSVWPSGSFWVPLERLAFCLHLSLQHSLPACTLFSRYTSMSAVDFTCVHISAPRDSGPLVTSSQPKGLPSNERGLVSLPLGANGLPKAHIRADLSLKIQLSGSLSSLRWIPPIHLSVCLSMYTWLGLWLHGMA